MVAVEALACSTPVISSDVGGLVGIINDEVGRVLPKENSLLLGETVRDVLEKKITFNRNKIQAYAKENYSQENLIDNLVKVYKKAK